MNVILRRLEEIRTELADLALQLLQQEQKNGECKGFARFVDLTVLHERPRIDLIGRYPDKAVADDRQEFSPGSAVDRPPPLVTGYL